MKAVIVEDEFAAVQNLLRLLKAIDENIEVIATLQNVDESIEWFSSNSLPDVVFMDIHLADGDSFSIFKSVEIRCPIIFITAYDQYALKAFEVNSIDYLLKPVSKDSLENALDKLERFAPSTHDFDVIARVMKSFEQNNKTRQRSFLIPFKDKLIPISSNDIAYVYSKNKKAVITTFNNREHTLDTSLDDFLKQLDPDLFFRANRQFIVARKAITDLSIWFDGKLSVNLSIAIPERIIVSRARGAEFKKWYTRTDE